MRIKKSNVLDLAKFFKILIQYIYRPKTEIERVRELEDKLRYLHTKGK